MALSDFIEHGLKNIQLGFNKLNKDIEQRKIDKAHYNDRIELLKRTKPVGWKELVVDINKHLENIKKWLELTPNIINTLNTNRIILTKLLVIERYISNHIRDYPIEYEQWDEDDVNDMYTGYYTRCNITMTIKNENSNHTISIAVPMDIFYLHNTEVKWWAFAELMISDTRNNEPHYYCRKDFGLVGRFTNDAEEENDDEDYQVFRIYNLKELSIIFQKFDSWYGSGLD